MPSSLRIRRISGSFEQIRDMLEDIGREYDIELGIRERNHAPVVIDDREDAFQCCSWMNDLDRRDIETTPRNRARLLAVPAPISIRAPGRRCDAMISISAARTALR